MGLDLGTLAATEGITERQSQLRHTTSAKLTAYGLECLQNAQQTGFNARELLVEACESLLDAIRYDRARLEPYLGMAYLLWLLGEYQQARDYLSEALALAPDNADAQTLLQELMASQRQASPPRQTIAPPLRPLPPKDFDSWYDEVEREIKDEIQTVSRIPPASFVVNNNRLHIEALER
ncbi:MAG: tetratricopeptide repeat protein, partial [Candidatus Sericytochromatia bacterium]